MRTKPQLSLDAIINGAPIVSSFQVRTNTSQRVADLKHDIKESAAQDPAVSNLLDRIEERQMVLWRVVIPSTIYDSNDEDVRNRAVFVGALETKRELELHERIGNVFGGGNSNPPGGMVYVGIQLVA
ncbi:hypothetical protein BGW39_002420 [Mortierella sp. 14UC]|nr:hypothetical protein BGW39_002420 [Mortierella sp. 14UC]